VANAVFFQVERHLRKLDQEVAKFKMELEADNAGITEILEKRAYCWSLCNCCMLERVTVLKRVDRIPF